MRCNQSPVGTQLAPGIFGVFANMTQTIPRRSVLYGLGASLGAVAFSQLLAEDGPATPVRTARRPTQTGLTAGSGGPRATSAQHKRRSRPTLATPVIRRQGWSIGAGLAHSCLWRSTNRGRVGHSIPLAKMTSDGTSGSSKAPMSLPSPPTAFGYGPSCRSVTRSKMPV